MAILSPYDYKTLATRAQAAASKLQQFRSSPYVSPKSLNVGKYTNLNGPISASTPAIIPESNGSYAREGQSFKGLGTVTVPYGGTTKYSSSRGHKAVDIANEKGTPIMAFTSGTVVGFHNGAKHGDKGYGNYVLVKDDRGGIHRYAHLDNTMPLSVGAKVKKGQYLGGMGDTGQTYSLNPKRTGVHLHYDLKYNGNYVDPFAYLITNFYNQKQYG